MEDHDILMLREVTSEPYNFKPKSSERGKVWESIATHLNSLKTPEFRVTVRAARDWYALLISWHKLKQREEEKASRIDVPELTELDALLEEIREREKIAEERTDALRNEKKANDEKEKAAAEEIRQAALKTMTKRKSDDSGEKPKRKYIEEKHFWCNRVFGREVREGERIEEGRVCHQKKESLI